MADYAGVLDIFTAALVAVAFVEIYYLSKAAGIANKQFLMLGKQSEILERQQGLANVAFFALHRPRLVLKDVFFSSPDNFGEVSFEVSNVGDSAALVSYGFATAKFVTDPRIFKDRTQGERELLESSGFRVGQLRRFAIRLDDTVQAPLRQLRAATQDPTKAKAERRYAGVLPPKGAFYFFGEIEYFDERGEERGATHLSVFRRLWDPETASFRRTDNPDQEYSD